MIPAGFVNVRSPLLPFEDLVRLGDGCRATGVTGAAADAAAVSAECDRIARELISAFERPVLKDALYIASRSLSERTRRLAGGHAGGNPQTPGPGPDPSVALGLMSYFT